MLPTVVQRATKARLFLKGSLHQWGAGVLDGYAGTEPQSTNPDYERGWLDGASAREEEQQESQDD